LSNFQAGFVKKKRSVANIFIIKTAGERFSRNKRMCVR